MNVACPLAHMTPQVEGSLRRLPLTGLAAATWALLDRPQACPLLEQVPFCMCMYCFTCLCSENHICCLWCSHLPLPARDTNHHTTHLDMQASV